MIGKNSGSMTPKARRTVLACVLAWFLDAWDTFLLVYVFTDIAHSFSVSLSTSASLLLITYSTRWLGGMIFGHVAALQGRKKALIIALAVASVFTGLTGAAPTFPMLIVIRLIFGIGMGGVYAAAGPLATESLPARGRGTGSGLFMFGFYAGVTVAPFVYYLVEPTWGWRPLFYIGSASLLLIPFIMYWVPESPVWLETRQRSQAADLGRPATVSVWSLFGKQFIAITIIMIGVEAAGFLSGYPFLTILPSYLKVAHHFSASVIALAGTLGGIGNMIGALIGGWLSDRIGRRRTYLLSYVLTLIPVAVGLLFVNPLIIYAGTTFTGVVTGAQGGMITAFENEHFPTEIRAAGNGFIHNIGSLFGTGASVITVFLRESIGFQGAILAFVAFGVLLGLVSIRFTTETRGISLAANSGALGEDAGSYHEGARTDGSRLTDRLND